MVLQKVVTPMGTGVQVIYKHLITLDSGFRRNDGKTSFQTFYEIIKFVLAEKPFPAKII
jgi:hypothetical protein